MNTEQFTTGFAMWVLLPLWVIMGFGDYICHRKSKIETTSGTPESVFHIVMLAEIGVPILISLLLEINSLALLIMMAAFLAHTVTTIFDVAYASSRRNVSLAEAIIHDFLMVFPFMGLTLMSCLHPQQFLAIFGLSSEAAQFSPQLKIHPLPNAYLIFALVISAVGLGAPYLEELVRCWLTAKRRVSPKSGLEQI